ncbi:MAG: hypothetical protein JXA09_17870 [Anaerolineae bacterium]|nr:hypothetical protein [Anaerolineae bacterium]
MSAIRTFILRLWVEPARPEALRGALQPMPEGEACPFAGEEALLALLRQMACRAEPPPRELQREEGEEERGA